jgi:ABC-2 type transport system permease protein
MVVLVPVWVIVAALFGADFSVVTPLNLLLGVLAIVVGFGISFFLGAIVTCLAFWTTRVYSFSEFLYGVTLMFGGLFVPLDLLPGGAQALARVLPFQLYLYFPTQLILGKLTPAQVVENFALQAGWLLVLYLVLQAVWRSGLKRFSAVGA